MCLRKLFDEFGPCGFMRKMRHFTVSGSNLRVTERIEQQTTFDRRAFTAGVKVTNVAQQFQGLFVAP